ncbi:MAG: VOC family protein [Saprospiraceae bacterium]|nr:VOC family protein [Saprospiraceae bacterium]
MEFYIQGLKFKIDWEHRFGPDESVYMQISSNGLTLHLSENKRFATGAIFFVECRGLNKLYAVWNVIKNNIEIAKPKKTNWQTTQMEIQDPFGNQLRFNEVVLD